MIVTLLFLAFIALMLLGVPIGAALGLAGATAIGIANFDAQWFGLLAVPQNFYAGLGNTRCWRSRCLCWSARSSTVPAWRCGW